MDQDNAFTTTASRRLSNESEFRVELHIVLQGLAFFWHQERDWREIEQFWESSPHSVVDITKYFLSAEIVESGVSIVETLLLRYMFNVFVLQTQAEPVETSSSCCLHEATLGNDVLNQFNLSATV